MKTIKDLIEFYEKELLFCDERINANIRSKDYHIAQNHKIAKLTILEFIDRLKNLPNELKGVSNNEQKEKIYNESYKILITNIPDFRKELMKMIEQVRYNNGEYSDGSSSQIAEKFEHKINSLV